MLPVYATTVNEDGNEDVTRLPTVLGEAPLGTYVGWNLATTGWYGPNASNGPRSVGQVFAGAGNSRGYMPFWDTKVHRQAANDPRLSLQERYGTHAGYVCVVTAAAKGGFEFGVVTDFAVLGGLAAILLAISARLFSKIEASRAVALPSDAGQEPKEELRVISDSKFLSLPP